MQAFNAKYLSENACIFGAHTIACGKVSSQARVLHWPLDHLRTGRLNKQTHDMFFAKMNNDLKVFARIQTFAVRIELGTT